MWIREKKAEKAQRTAVRRQQEDDAPRLLEATQGLCSLFIELKESNERSADPDSRYIRRFMVKTAPALFLIPCGDPKCRGGGHDLTGTILEGLRSRQTRTEGENQCAGVTGEESCARRLHFEAVAAFE